MRVSFCRHRVEALVHLAHGECDDHSLGGLCDGPTEVAVAVDVLNRMLEMGRPKYVRTA